MGKQQTFVDSTLSAAETPLAGSSIVEVLAEAVARNCYHGPHGTAVVEVAHELRQPLDLPTEKLHATIVPRERVMIVRSQPGPVVGVFDPEQSPKNPRTYKPPEVIRDLDVVTIDLAYQYHCIDRARARVPTWLSMMDIAIDHLRAGGLARLPAAKLVNVEQSPLFDERHLAKFRTLTSLLRCTYHVPREAAGS